MLCRKYANMLSIVTLNVIMLNVVMLNVIMLNVVAPFRLARAVTFLLLYINLGIFCHFLPPGCPGRDSNPRSWHHESNGLLQCQPATSSFK